MAWVAAITCAASVGCGGARIYGHGPDIEQRAGFDPISADTGVPYPGMVLSWSGAR